MREYTSLISGEVYDSLTNEQLDDVHIQLYEQDEYGNSQYLDDQWYNSYDDKYKFALPDGCFQVRFEKNYYGIFFPSRNFDRNMEPNRTILKEFRRFFLLYPQSPYLEEIREYQLKARAELAEHEFLVGNFYFRGKLYTSAAERYLYHLQNYPEFPRTEEVARKLIQAYQLNGEPLLANEMEEVLSSFLQRQVSPSGNS